MDVRARNSAWKRRQGLRVAPLVHCNLIRPHDALWGVGMDWKCFRVALCHPLLGRNYRAAYCGWHCGSCEEAALESLALVSDSNRIRHRWLLGYRGRSFGRMGVAMVDKILKWLNGIKTDKLLHFIVALLVAQLLYALLSICCGKWMSVLGSMFLASMIAAVKELYDIGHGVASWKDILASVTGIMVGLIIIVLV